MKKFGMNFDWHCSNIKVCKSCKDENLSRYFASVTNSLSVHNIFNPSFYCDDNVKLFAFRAIIDGEDCLTSFISIEDKIGRSVKKISAEFYQEFGAPRLIDPKVARLNDEYYVTFNSGWVPEGNDIFIMKIYPTMGHPKRLIYKGRQQQERNWAFFFEKNEIYALYWINPLKIVKLKYESGKNWEMEDYYCGKTPDPDFPTDLTIGTQLFYVNGQYRFVAHQKRYLHNKKIYLGRFCTFDFERKKVIPGKYWLSHSMQSILGSDIKHNSNLFSCTYFSGLQASNGSIKLGYGINDTGFGFSAHNLNEL